MRVHEPLDDILRGKGVLHVLRVLCRHSGSSFTGRNLARLGEIPVSHVQSALRILESEGLVDRRVAGRSHLWTLCEENALVDPLRQLFVKERALSGELSHELATGLRGLPVRRALLFGSVARGEERGASDVDLFVEVERAADRDKVADRLFSVGRRVRARYGLNLAPIVVDRAEIRSRMSPSFIASVERDGTDLLGFR